MNWFESLQAGLAPEDVARTILAESAWQAGEYARLRIRYARDVLDALAEDMSAVSLRAMEAASAVLAVIDQSEAQGMADDAIAEFVRMCIPDIEAKLDARYDRPT
jgi:hypothetical protein